MDSTARRVRKIAKSDCWLHRVWPSARTDSTLAGRIFIKLDIWEFLKKCVQKIQVSLRSDKNNGTLHGDRYVCIYENILLNYS